MIREEDRETLKSYSDYLKNTKLLTKEEEQALFKRIRMCDTEARNAMAHANMRLVIRYACKAAASSETGLSDLIQYGAIGLMCAIDKYDETRDLKFSTFATPYIKGAILSNTNDVTRQFVGNKNASLLVTKTRQLVRKYEDEQNRLPDVEEVSKDLNISENIAKSMMRISTIPLSLNYTIGGEDDSSGKEIQEYLSSLTSGSAFSESEPEAAAERSEILCRISDVLMRFSERKRKIFYKRYWPMEERNMTRGEVAREFGVSCERIRMIENEIFYALRKSFKETMSDYAEGIS